MAKKLIWILVTDGAHARIFERKNKLTSIYQIKNLTHTHTSTHEHDDGKPGRVFNRMPPIRHAYEPRTDWHEHQKEIFIQELIHVLIKEHQEKEFSRVYLICPPKIMGFLRSSILPYVKSLPFKEKLDIKEIPKDLAHHTIEEIEELINIAD